MTHAKIFLSLLLLPTLLVGPSAAGPVHGIAMLAIDGQLKQPTDDVIRFANERLRTGIESLSTE